jgi:hypothetical protein
MIFEKNFQNRIQKKAAWLRGKRNQAVIPKEIAHIKDVLFVRNVLSYCVEYEDGKIGYIGLDELENCEIFALETKIDKETIVSV